jgi:hypothetical protein
MDFPCELLSVFLGLCVMGTFRCRATGDFQFGVYSIAQWSRNRYDEGHIGSEHGF